MSYHWSKRLKRSGKRHQRHPNFLRLETANRFAIKSPLNNDTRITHDSARKSGCSCGATPSLVRAGRVQLVNQRMNRNLTGQTGGCVIRAYAHQFSRVCVSGSGVCVLARGFQDPAAIWSNLEAINCGWNIGRTGQAYGDLTTKGQADDKFV